MFSPNKYKPKITTCMIYKPRINTCMIYKPRMILRIKSLVWLILCVIILAACVKKYINDSICNYIRESNIEKAERLIVLGIGLDGPFNMDWPLKTACSYDNLQLVKLILKHKGHTSYENIEYCIRITHNKEIIDYLQLVTTTSTTRSW